MQVITETVALEKFVEDCQAEDAIAVDTEFDRAQTYYSKLCLVQIATGNQEVIIDPLAEGLSNNAKLAQLKELFADTRITKIFHSAREDIETIYSNLNVIPNPVFDTQIAAAELGLALKSGAKIGYGDLVEAMTGDFIDKSQTRSNWEKRPLSKKQMEYAISDVVHLLKIYRLMQEMLESKPGVNQKLRTEFAKLVNESLYMNKPEDAWKRIQTSRLSPESFENLKRLTEFRERKAQELNLPRKWVMGNRLVLEIACMKESEKAADIASISSKEVLNNNILEEFLNLLKEPEESS